MLICFAFFEGGFAVGANKKYFNRKLDHIGNILYNKFFPIGYSGMPHVIAFASRPHCRLDCPAHAIRAPNAF